MRRAILAILVLLLPSICFAQGGMMPGPGCKGYSAACTTQEDSCTGGGTEDTSAVGNDAEYNIWVASPFTVDSTYTVCKIDLYLFRTGTPGNNLTACIYNDSGSQPSTQVGTCSDAVVANTIGTDYAYVSFVNVSAAVSAGTYWIVLKADAASGYVNFTNYKSSTTCDIGAGVKVYDGATWSVHLADYGMWFKTYQ